jgi:hypothetical protein
LQELELGEDFSISLSHDSVLSDLQFRLEISYWVSGNLAPEQYEGVALAIWQDFSVAFEDYQGLGLGVGSSSFANQDLPSDYLAMVAVMRGQSLDSVLFEVGDGTVSYQSGPDIEHASLPLRSEPARNHAFTPRVPDENGTYVNIPWPEGLQVDANTDATLWGRQAYHSSYASGAYWVDANYNRDGSLSSFFCTFCTTPR